MLVKARPDGKGSKLKKPFKWAQSFSNATFRCPVKCDACCRRSIGPGLTEKDYQRISRQASQYNVAEKRDHPLFPYQLKAREGACLFLNKQGQCSIYSIRPILCRLYPLQLHIQWDGKLLWCLEHCPGVGVEKGIALEEAYLESLLLEILEIESETFLGTLREYMLNTKYFLTILFKTTSTRVYSDWVTKTKMKKIVWKMFQAKALKGLTPRGRLECVLHDLLPPLKEILVNMAVQLPGRRGSYIDQRMLSAGKMQYQFVFPFLSFESAAREKMHLKDLEKKGNILYGAEDGGTIRYSQQSSIIVHGFDGRKINVEIAKLMHMLTMSPEVSLVEENYLNELQRREGRFGTKTADLPINSEVYLMFLVADALELKANAFAIEKGKERIGIEEMKEAIWVVERTLSELMEMARNWGTSKQLVHEE